MAPKSTASDRVTKPQMKLIDSYLDTPPTRPLYHYTDAAGLIGIMRTKRIWASSIQHLNDTQEFAHAIGLIEEELNSRGRYYYDYDPASPRWALKEEAREWFRRLDETLRNEISGLKDTTLYVASFSEHKDVLSQWRGYCRDGNGYSIGFMPSVLTEPAKAGFRLVKCVYDPKEQKGLCNALIDSYFEISQRPPSSKALLRSMQKLTWGTKFSILAAAMKHESFREESEWRLVCAPERDHAVHFRSGRFGIVPYLEVPLSSENQKVPVAELVVGPTADRRASLLGAEAVMGDLARRQLGQRLRLDLPRSRQQPLRMAVPNERQYIITMSTSPYRN